MDTLERDVRARAAYAAPKVLASYSTEELAEAIRPHGQIAGYQEPGCGGGCGCGNIQP